MHYRQAVRQSIIKRVLGAIVFLVGGISTAISFLRMLYFNFDDGTAIGSTISKVFQKLVYTIYEHTQFLNFFWEHCPTPSLNQINTQDNVYFILLYLSIFVGAALYSSGKKLAIRLKIINEAIENQLIRESIRGERARSRHELESTMAIENSSIFSQVHQLYIAPLIITVVGGIILKLSGF
jgi:hypothetical protein